VALFLALNIAGWRAKILWRIKRVDNSPVGALPPANSRRKLLLDSQWGWSGLEDILGSALRLMSSVSASACILCLWKCSACICAQREKF
jgi:hypothetical protein